MSLLWRTPVGEPGASDLGQARRVILLQEGPNPSSAYCLLPWLAQQGWVPIEVDSRQPPAWELQEGDFVVVARYVHPHWQKTIQQARTRLAGLAWFVDDELLDGAAHAHLPEAYRKKLQRFATRHRAWFERMGAVHWWATAALAQRYRHLGGPCLQAVALPEVVPDAATVRTVYHGSASHAQEQAWLLPILQAVQARCPHHHVELIGDHALYQQWRSLPRVSMLHPMAWPQYLEYTRSHRADIGLAPLLPGAFNDARGAVKFFDYARMGAVGLFADSPAYAQQVQHGVNGLLLPMVAERWEAELVALIQDPERRARLRPR